MIFLNGCGMCPAELALFYFNLALVGIAIGSEMHLVIRDKRQKSRFMWFGIGRILLLVMALYLIIWVNVHDLIPDYNPMRLVLTFILLHITIKDTYELTARSK